MGRHDVQQSAHASARAGPQPIEDRGRGRDTREMAGERHLASVPTVWFNMRVAPAELEARTENVLPCAARISERRHTDEIAAALGIKVLYRTSSLVSMKCGDANTPRYGAQAERHRVRSRLHETKARSWVFVGNGQLKKCLGLRRGSRTAGLMRFR